MIHLMTQRATITSKATSGSATYPGWGDSVTTTVSGIPCQTKLIEGAQQVVFGSEMVLATHMASFPISTALSAGDDLTIDGRSYQCLLTVPYRNHHLVCKLRELG